jgi:hypothetical protein
MNTHLKTKYMAEGLIDLLSESFGKFNKRLPTYYALVELIIWKPRFKVADIVKLTNSSTAIRTSRVTLLKRLSELVDRNIIVRSRPNYRSIYTYDLSPKAIERIKVSTRYFQYFTNARDKRNAVASVATDPLTHDSSRGVILPPMSGYHEWESLMEPGLETELFLHAYNKLTSQWNIYLGTRSLDPNPRLPFSVTNLPRLPFRIDQPPESFGRVGSKPYSFIGKSHLPDLHPAHDPGLKHGLQFMLDFSAFEPRILAYFIKQPELLEMANSAGDMYHEIFHRYLSSYPITDSKHLILSWINGAGVQGISKFISPPESGEQLSDVAEDILNKLQSQFPEIEALRIQMADSWSSNNELRTPDGSLVPLHYTKKKKQGIKTLTKGERQRKSIALFLQTYSGLLGRQVIIEAQHLKYAYLRLCVYDGFMFYCKKEHYETAMMEVSELLSRVSKELFPTVLMPFKLEWSSDDNGINYGDSYVPRRDGMININITPSLTHHDSVPIHNIS